MNVYQRFEELPEWLTPKQAASFLGVSDQSVYSMLKRNRFEVCFRVEDEPGGRWRIAKESVGKAVGILPCSYKAGNGRPTE